MHDSKLKIALLPNDIAWGDIEENLHATAHRLNRVAPDTDIAVVPEMFTTGFITEPTLLCSIDERRTADTFEHIRRWAQYFRIAIAGSIVATEGNNCYNRAFFIEPSGDETFYDKRHLFSMGGESRTFTPGRHHCPIIRYRGCNIMMSVCYDLRFPVWNRNTDLKYDLLIIPANWPDSRIYAWRQLLTARAIENQAYVAGCNRTGSDDYGTYGEGYSYVLNDWGENCSTVDPETGIVYATIDLAKLERHRNNFGVWRDADPFAIDI